MIDQLLLGLEPFTPADPANLVECPASQVILKWLKGHPLAVQPATSAVERCHPRKIVSFRM
jgi:hypothetical protein